MADLSFKIRADVSELERAYKVIDNFEKKVANINKSIGEVDPGSKKFKELSKELGEVEKQYEKALKQIIELSNAQRTQAQEEVTGTQAVIQSKNEAIASERLKQETSKTSIQQTKAQIQAINLEIAQLKQRRAFDNDSSKRAVSEAEVTKILNTQVSSIRQAENQNKRLRIAVKDVTGEDKEAAKTRTLLNDRIQKNTEFIKRNTDAYIKQKMAIGQYKQGIKEAIVELQKGGNTMNSVKSIAGNLGGALKTQVSGGLDSIRMGVGSMISGFVGAQAIVSGFRKIGAAIKSGIDSIIGFEAANSKLAAILGETKGSINELIYDAKRLGATTRYTASEVTNLQIELAKLGFSKKEILESTESVLKFAQATGAELAEAAALAGASIRMFGATTQDTEKYVASMAVATTKSALSFSYLQTAMPTVGPVAKAFNFTIEDTLALLGKLADAGFDASSAATATRNILLNLADSNGKLAKELGGNVKTLPEMVEGLVSLKEKGIDLASTLELTDKRSVAAFNTFLSGADSINALRDSITDVEGDLTKMANTMTDNVEGAILGLSSAWEAFMLSFMGSTGPAKSVIDFFAKGLREIAKDLASPDERQNMQNAEAISLKKQQMQEFKVIEESAKRVKELYDQKVAAGIEANQAEIEAKEEYLQSYRKDLEKESALYETLQKEKQATQEKYENASFWKQATFFEKTNRQYEKQIDLQVSGMSQLKGNIFKNESVISSVEGMQLNPTENKTYTVPKKLKLFDYIDVYKQTQEIKKSSQAVKDAILKSEADILQQQTDLLENGSEKQLAQIRLNYEKRVAEIQKQEREALILMQDEERKKWEKENPTYKKKNLQFVTTITELPQTDRDRYDKEYSLAFDKQEKDTKVFFDKMLKKYQDYDTQRLEIEKQHNDDIATLQANRTDANAEEIDRAIKVAQDKMKEATQKINDEEASTAKKDNPFLKRLFGDYSQMKFDDLQKLIDQAKLLQSSLSGNGDAEGLTFISKEQLSLIAKSPTELENLQKALDKLLKGGKSNSWDAMFENFNKGLAKLKSSNNLKDVSAGMQDIGEAAAEASSVLAGVAGSLSDMFDAMGNSGAAEATEAIQEGLNAISNIGEGFAKGGIIGGIAAAVGEAANFIGKAFAANARHKEALKAVMDEATAQQREYNLLLLEQNLLYEKGITIFGTDVYGKASNAVANLKKSIAELNKELAGSQAQKNEQRNNSLLSSLFGVQDANSALKQSYAGLANVEIKTGHKKTGLFGWGKGKDIYSSILDVYPRLVDANGKFDKELASTIINTREMSDESKNALQNMIDLAQQAEEAYKVLNDYMTDIFGELGNSMSDALVSAFANGTNAAQDFTSSVSKMLETLAKQMVYSVTLAPIIEKAQKQMMDVMQSTGLTDEQKFNQWAGILDSLVDGAIEQQGYANSLYEEFKKLAANKGFDIFGPESGSSQGSSNSSFQTMSQDVGNELKGRFTALNISSESILAQSISHTDLLNSINEKMVNNQDADTMVINGEKTSPTDVLTESLLANISQRESISSQLIGQITLLTGEVVGLRGIVDEMRSKQVEQLLDVSGIVENTGVLAKNAPRILAKLDASTNSLKSMAGR